MSRAWIINANIKYGLKFASILRSCLFLQRYLPAPFLHSNVINIVFFLPSVTLFLFLYMLKFPFVTHANLTRSVSSRNVIEGVAWRPTNAYIVHQILLTRKLKSPGLSRNAFKSVAWRPPNAYIVHQIPRYVLLQPSSQVIDMKRNYSNKSWHPCEHEDSNFQTKIQWPIRQWRQWTKNSNNFTVYYVYCFWITNWRTASSQFSLRSAIIHWNRYLDVKNGETTGTK